MENLQRIMIIQKKVDERILHAKEIYSKMNESEQNNGNNLKRKL